MNVFVPIRCLRGEEPENDREFDVTKVFRESVLSENDKPWTRKKSCYHPSALSGCKRAIYYDRIGIEPKSCWNFETLMFFDLGHALHDMVQKRLMDAIPGFQPEVTVDFKELNIYGHCDGVFAEQDWVLEIKTIGSSGFGSLIRPKKDHVMQMHCYMAGLDIPRAQLVYVNRDNGMLRKFDVFFDDEVWAKCVAVISTVEEAIEANEPPPKELNKWVCRTCKFKHECQPEF